MLYEIDPFGMGSAVSAPDDEYEPVAMRLMPLLKHATNAEDCAEILRKQGIHGEGVAQRVWASFADQ
ncbi:hypothetical protein V6U77_23220 [Micromonospora sp. CPCC 205546]|uniref:hypothetical protein n=1 Tax=Micromonospora sp. CPCC 205546 TaxID=3122397 RepID=UPI002FF22151